MGLFLRSALAGVLFTSTLFLSVSLVPSFSYGDNFVRGDVNGDSTITMLDLLHLIHAQFDDGPNLLCPDAADLDDNGEISIIDTYLMLTFLYHNRGTDFPAPFPDAGSDDTDDDLDSCTLPGVEYEAGYEVDHVFYTAVEDEGLGAIGLAISVDADEIRVPVYHTSNTDTAGLTVTMGYRSEYVDEVTVDFENSYATDANADRLDFQVIEGDEELDFIVFYLLPVIRQTEGEDEVLSEGDDQLVAELVLTLSTTIESGDNVTLRYVPIPSLGNEPELNSEVITPSLLSHAPTTHNVSLPVVLPEDLFLRGDSNRDGSVTLLDALLILRYMFDEESVACLDALDFDDDGLISIVDALGQLGFLFLDLDNPAAPYPHTGIDPTDTDEFACEESPDDTLATDDADEEDSHRR